MECNTYHNTKSLLYILEHMANIPMARICFFPSPGRYREGIAFAIAASDEILKIQGILSRAHLLYHYFITNKIFLFLVMQEETKMEATPATQTPSQNT